MTLTFEVLYGNECNVGTPGTLQQHNRQQAEHNIIRLRVVWTSLCPIPVSTFFIALSAHIIFCYDEGQAEAVAHVYFRARSKFP